MAEFSSAIKKHLERQAGGSCSNPDCRAPTSGPVEDPGSSSSVGDAAHIVSPRPDGARHVSNFDFQAADNGIWLCVCCHRMVDNDERTYPRQLLEQWKRSARVQAKSKLGRPAASSYAPFITYEIAANSLQERSLSRVCTFAALTLGCFFATITIAMFFKSATALLLLIPPLAWRHDVLVLLHGRKDRAHVMPDGSLCERAGRKYFTYRREAKCNVPGCAGAVLLEWAPPREQNTRAAIGMCAVGGRLHTFTWDANHVGWKASFDWRPLPNDHRE
jgi:hypothetical protein